MKPNPISTSIVLLLPIVAAFASFAKAAEELPAWTKVEAIVSRHFATLSSHEPADLIARSEVRPIFGQLEILGWEVSDEPAILRDILDDSNFLVQQTRTPAGRKFMRKVGTEPMAYDQLDNVTRLPGGRLMLKDFLRFNHSEKSLEAEGGKFMARLVRLTPDQSRGANVPTRDDFLKPTGRIYTEAQLIERLKQSYDAEILRRNQVSRN